MTLDLNLLCKDHIADLFATTTNIGTAPHHELITDDTDGKVIDTKPMILAAHHFRRHIAWCARCVRRVLSFQYFGDAHVCDAYVAIVFHHNVFRLDVTVDYALIMHVFKAKYHTGQHELCFLLIEAATLANMEPQVTACEQITDQIDVLTVLKRVVYVYEERMLEFLQQFLLTHD